MEASYRRHVGQPGRTLSALLLIICTVTSTEMVEEEFHDDWGDFKLTPLVRYGLYCKNIKDIQVEGVPQTTGDPFKMSIYELISDSSAYTLHLFMHSPTQPYKYLVLMPINENGIPAGHFHHQVCSDPKAEMNGEHNINRYCTRKETEVGQLWGDTSLMYITPREGQTALGEEDAFWSWHPKDGDRPKKLQFRLAAIQDTKDNKKIFWVDILSPVIEVRDQVKYIEANDADMSGVKCYADILDDESDGNFIIASDQTPLKVNVKYMMDLFPDFKAPTTTTAVATTSSTTDEPIIPIDYEEWGDFALTPLVQHGLYCKNIKDLAVNGRPQTTDLAIKLIVYELIADSSAFTLHLVAESSSKAYHYFILMAINEKGIPTGHFHHQVCSDAKTDLNGMHNINRYCTKKEDGLGKKWGDTSLMFITPMRPGQAGLVGKQNAFWSWHPKDGERPSKLQFRLSIIKTENSKNLFWVNILSPVIELRDKIKYVEANDADITGVKCFKDILNKKSDRNFIIAADQAPLKVNMDYLTDLFPDLRMPTTTTVVQSTALITTTVITTVTPRTSTTTSTAMTTTTQPSSTTKLIQPTTLSTTEEPIIPIDYEDWGDFTLTPLVRHGLYCKNIKDFNIGADPQQTNSPLKMELYELIAESSAYTLHLVMDLSPQSCQYVVLMAINEKGIPTGHFHHQVCSDAKTDLNGLHNINRYCTKKEAGFGKKWGDTSFMFITPRPGHTALVDKQDAFWSWHPKDGLRPTKVQFRIAVIKTEDNKDSIFWVNILSPIIEVRDKIKYVEANDADMAGVKCFTNILDGKSSRNFILALDQTPLRVNMEYMTDLFPDLRVPTTTTVATTTVIPSTTITTTVMVTTETVTTTAFPTTVAPSSSSLAASTSTTTTVQPSTTIEVVPTTTSTLPTTEEPIIPIDYEEWGDFTLTPLVRHGLYCKNIREFDVHGTPESSDPPLKLTIYELTADSSAFTLHLFVHSTTQSYQYLVIMAINERGIPTGHFHHQVCSDARAELNGLHNINRYCTRKENGVGKKWGDTSLMFITPRSGVSSLGEQDAFWSWSTKDGERPSRLQFRIAAIQTFDEGKAEAFWVNILSPVIELRDKVKYVEANDADMSGVKCFAHILDDKSDRNFIIAANQAPLRVNMDYMTDLFPDLWAPTTTTLSPTTMTTAAVTTTPLSSTTIPAITSTISSTIAPSTLRTTTSQPSTTTEAIPTTTELIETTTARRNTVSTTEEPVISIDYEEWGDFTLTPLVRHGLYCKNIREIDTDGDPQTTDPPLKLTIYELIGESSANTLHLFMHSPTQSYHYLVLMAINEKGIPTGHFHHQVCSDPNSELNGVHNINRYCTRKENGVGKKWGDTSLMFVTPRSGHVAFGEQDAFWSWHPKDGGRPSKLQFRLAIVQNAGDGKNIFWTKILSPVIDVRDKLKYVEANDADMAGVKCFANILDEKSDQNFIIATDQTALKVNMEYMIDLFPDLRVPTTTTPATTTVITSTGMTTTTVITTEVPTTTIATSTVTSTLPSISSTQTVATTTEAVPTTTEIATTTAAVPTTTELATTTAAVPTTTELATTTEAVPTTTELATTTEVVPSTTIKTTAPRAITSSTTEEPIISIDYEEWGDFTLTPLVRHGLFCKNIREFEVKEAPETNDPPLKLTIYELIADSSAYTLHLVMHSPTQSYEYVVLMAINEKGIPTGHFQHQVCSDPKSELNGLHNINRYCTRKENGVGEKWNDTSLMYITPRPGQATLGEQDAFWSWHPKDGERPLKLQFRLAVIQDTKDNGGAFWVNMLSPVFEVRDKIKYAEANDADMSGVKCFVDVLDEKSNRNFIVASDQTPLRVNMEYMIDLFPDLRVPGTTTTATSTVSSSTAVVTATVTTTEAVTTTTFPTTAASTSTVTTSQPSTTTEIIIVPTTTELTTTEVVPTTTEMITTTEAVLTTTKLITTTEVVPNTTERSTTSEARATIPPTTEEPIISIDYDEWGDFTLTPLVRHGLFCKNIREIDVDGAPQTTDPPVKLSIYELISESSAYTLHLIMQSPSQSYKYLVVTATNEKGLPRGHFHHQVCTDPKAELKGLHNLNRYCTQKGTGFGEKWGDTSLMFITPRPGQTTLSEEQDAFWSWHPKDGARPSKVQFRVAIVKTEDSKASIFWVNIVSPVIEVRDKIKYVEANDADMHGVKCFANILDEKSDRNFIIATDQTPLKVNMEYMIDLFPGLRVPTTTTLATTTAIPSSTITTTTMVTTETALISTTSPTTAAPISSSLATSTFTTLQPSTTTEIVPTTTELVTIAETTTSIPTTTTVEMTTTTLTTSTTSTAAPTETSTITSTIFPSTLITTTLQPTTTTEVVPTTKLVKTTKAKPNTPSTTEEPIISIDYDEWGDFILTPLVRHGLYCKNIRDFEVEGVPQTTDPPVQLTIYELIADSSAYTLHLSMHPLTQPYHYLVLMAINENGIPAGHFHHQVCSDARAELNGLHSINRYCTRKENGVGKKWGDTSLMYVMPRKAQATLGEQDAFWSWHPKDGGRPFKLQFRMAAIKSEDSKKNIFWVNILSPVYEVRDKIKYAEANDADMTGVKCFKDILDEKSNRNFIIASDQTPLKVNMEYMIDLFPDLRVPTTTTPVTTTIIPSTVVATTTIETTNIPTTSPATSITVSSTPFLSSTSMITTTQSSTTVKTILTTTEVITATEARTSPTTSTTEEPIISIDYVEWGDFILSPLVRHGLYCKNIKDIEVEGVPKTTDPPVKLSIYELIADSSANTLHLVMRSLSQPYKYLVLMVINEKGVPTGHFHHQVCVDAKPELNGLHNLNRYCTTKEDGFGQKWGDTSLMYITPRPGHVVLGEQDAFWSWNPKDGERPSRFQFRLAVIQAAGDKKNIFWVKILSPVIQFREKVKYVEANDADMTGVKCFAHILDEKSDRNFIFATDQTPLKVNMEYMIDLFPELRPTTTPLPTTTTEGLLNVTSTTVSPILSSSTVVLATTQTTTSPTTTVLPTTSTTISPSRVGLVTTETEPRSTTTTILSTTTTENTTAASTTPTASATETVPQTISMTEATAITSQPTSTTVTITQPPTAAPSTPGTTAKTSTETPAISSTTLMETTAALEITTAPSLPPTTNAHTTAGPTPQETTFAPIPTTVTTSQAPTVAPSTAGKPALITTEGPAIVTPKLMETTAAVNIKSTLEVISTTEPAAVPLYVPPQSLNNSVPINITWDNSYFIDKNNTKELDILKALLEEQGAKPFKPPNDEFRIHDNNTQGISKERAFTAINTAPSAVKPKVRTLQTPEKGEKPESVEEENEEDEVDEGSVDARSTGNKLEPPNYNKVPPFNLLRSKHVYHACRMGKGCLGDTVGCVKRRNCRILVTYSTNHDREESAVRFELIGPIQGTKGYVAVGISDDRKMGDDVVVECIMDPDGNEAVFYSWNKEHDNYRPPESKKCTKMSDGGTIAKCDVTQEDGNIICHFFMKTKIEIERHTFDLTNKPYYIFQAIGSDLREIETKTTSSRRKRSISVRSQERKKAKKKKRKRKLAGSSQAQSSGTGSFPAIGKHSEIHISRKPVRISKNEAPEPTYGEKTILKLHGVFMIIAWITIVPNAAFIARYFKESYRHVQFFGYPVWLLVHIVSIAFAAFFIILGAAFALYHTFGVIGTIPCEYEEWVHFVVGWIACALFFVQVVIGTLRPKEVGVGKTIVDAIHFFVGTISYVLALFLIGRSHLLVASYFPCNGALLILIWIAWSLLVHAIVSINTFLTDHHDLHLKTLRAVLPWPFPVITEKPVPGEFFRTNAFAFHAAGAAIASTWLIVPYLVSKQSCGCHDNICF